MNPDRARSRPNCACHQRLGESKRRRGKTIRSAYFRDPESNHDET